MKILKLDFGKWPSATNSNPQFATMKFKYDHEHSYILSAPQTYYYLITWHHSRTPRFQSAVYQLKTVQRYFVALTKINHFFPQTHLDK